MPRTADAHASPSSRPKRPARCSRHGRAVGRNGGIATAPAGLEVHVARERADTELARLVGPVLPRARQVGDVFIRPFEVVLNGVRHGLVYDDLYEAAIFHPRDVWFYFPWDTGDYDT